MGYLLNAWLEDGAPRLRLINPVDGSVSLTWDGTVPNQTDRRNNRHELHSLFRKLILLSCAQESNLHSLTRKGVANNGQ